MIVTSRRLKLAIVSGMPFYERDGEFYMSHQYEVLCEIERYFEATKYIGEEGDPAELLPGFSRVDGNRIKICAMPKISSRWASILCHAPWIVGRMMREIQESDVVLAKLSGYRGALGALAGHILGKMVVTYLIVDPAFVSSSCSGLGRVLEKAKGYIRRVLWPIAFRSGHLRLYIARCWAKKYLDPPRPTDSEYIEVALLPSAGKLRNTCSGRHTLLFVGRITRDKGVGDLLAAVKLLKERGVDYQLLLAGRGEEVAAMETLAARLGVDGRVRFLGFIPQGDQLRSVYAESDMIVLPSYTDALPLVLLEAMAAGLPIVTTTVGGIPDLVEDHINGLLVSPGSPRALADAIERLLRDPILCADMSVNNRAKAQFHSTPAETERLCKAIYGALGLKLPLPKPSIVGVTLCAQGRG